MKVAIIGNGICGSALEAWFKKVMATPENIIDGLLIHDPPQGLDESENVKLCDYVFVCVPVPISQTGAQDISILLNSIQLCRGDAKIFVRSTVLPNTCDEIAMATRRPIHAMPEFLTERRSYADMSRLDIICGCSINWNVNIFVAEELKKLFPNKQIKCVSNIEAEMSKFMHNILGCVKVNFANVINELCDEYGADYKTVKSLIGITGYFSPLHLDIAQDGKKGFGGKCFEPNIRAFERIAKSEMINGCVKDNKKFRSE